MESRKVLIYLATKFRGNWNKIFDFIKSKENIEEEDVNKVYANMKSKAVTMVDEDYPVALKTIYKPPFVLFYHGDISLIQDKLKCLSVVGSRDNSEYGEQVTRALVGDLSKYLVIVSGMARGIDSIAHKAALENNGRTVAVLGCGINVCYPASNLEIYDELIKNHLVISEYPDLTQPSPGKFPIRNRIVSGLSYGLLITEAKRNSGTSITATITLENGGEVCCVPTQIGRDSLCNYLIANGAALVETAKDVLDQIEFKIEKPIFGN